MNYYNDSLVNDPNFGLDNENIEDAKNAKDAKDDKDNNDKKVKTEENLEDEVIEVRKEMNPPNEISTKSEESKESTKDQENTDNKQEEEKTVKVVYKNDNIDNNDKTSSCHIMFHSGADIDITTKKIFECVEEVSNRSFLLFKRKYKIKTFIFIEEQYMYLLKDIIINKNNEKLRRISIRYDLNQLFDYKVLKQDNK